jgi:hypothetical protein
MTNDPLYVFFFLTQILVFVAILAAAVAVPQTSSKDAQITAYSNDVGLDGYNFQ